MLVFGRRVEYEILRDAVSIGGEFGRETSLPALRNHISRATGVWADDEVMPALKRLYWQRHIGDFQKWNQASQWFERYCEYEAMYGQRADSLFFYRGSFNIIVSPNGRVYMQELEATISAAMPRLAPPPPRRRIGFGA